MEITPAVMGRPLFGCQDRQREGGFGATEPRLRWWLRVALFACQGCLVVGALTIGPAAWVAIMWAAAEGGEVDAKAKRASLS
jgi:hypothetical protein